MIRHIVLWTLKEHAEGSSREENLKKVKSELESLKNKIPVIQSMHVGINFDTSSDAFDIILNADFNNKEDLKIYQEHPEHLKVVQFLRKVRDKRVVADYEI